MNSRVLAKSWGSAGWRTESSRFGRPAQVRSISPIQDGSRLALAQSGNGALGSNRAVAQVVQHATVAQNDYGLLEAVVVVLGLRQDLAA